MKKSRMEKIIELTGERHDLEIVTYGMTALLDGCKTILTITILGIISHHILDSMIYLFFSFIGTSTLGGITLKHESPVLYGQSFSGQ